ncbi:MAG: hypothetical protein IJC02_13230 [Lachnospiraceae bacterium]|nr:hypothetical protein [Lachnospiraceae bacterium]MBQ6995930.1 hypothetical protein [Lachnospiraceae bacterium]
MIQVCMIAAAGMFAAIIIKKDKPEYATLIILLVSFLIALKVVGVLSGVLDEIQAWSNLLQENVIYVNLLLKLIGITYLCEFATNICKDAGYSTLSSHVELFGKIMIMMAGLPVVKTMIEMIEGMLR